MGGLLRDWLGLALEREISEGLDWSRESAASKAKIRNSQALEDMYHDDGSNLRFTYSPGERSAVQVFDVRLTNRALICRLSADSSLN